MITILVKQFLRLSVMRQMGVWLGFIISLALSVYGIHWALSPDYLPLYTALEPKEIGRVTEALDRAEVRYQFHAGSGGILVPADKIHELRMKLATLGLPKSGPIGLERMDEPLSFMSSHFAEFVRYQRGLEGELSRTLSTLTGIRNATVHLGLTKEASFLKKQSISTASVVLEIVGGKVLTREQVEGIVQLVASSVPGLSKSSVCVVDQHGTLLSGREGDAFVSGLDSLHYTQKIEESYVKRIEHVLFPILGKNAIRAQVTADIDFTAIDQVKEQFDPNSSVIRSENILTERKAKKTFSEGTPGAFSNQALFINNDALLTPASKAPANHLRDQSTRNFEVDKSITHIKRKAGRLSRLSVAVVVDDKQVYDAQGNQRKVPLTEVDLEKIETLVKHAVGFQADRGDMVSVTHATFSVTPIAAPISVSPVYDHPLFRVFLKVCAISLLGIVAIRLILKPLILQLIFLKKKEETAVTNTVQEKEVPLLQRISLDNLLALLAHEHPQVQASILSYLTPQQGAAILKTMSEEIRMDVMMRLATLSPPAPEALEALNAMLKEKLSSEGAV
ncbi:MAG: hypothetical protein RLZ35_649 [Pseudomonadota bacterium]|jgi:flagellar M-ring protein FliF